MTPERILKTYSNELVQEITRLESAGQVELLTGDMAAFGVILGRLINAGAAIDVDFGKYDYKGLL